MATILEPIHIFWTHLQSGMMPQWGLWNYILLAALVAIEGPIATLLGAAAASAGLMKVPFVFLAAAVGNLSADIIWYSIGYTGKIEWIFRVNRWFRKRKHLVEKLKEGMREHAIKILLFAKLTAGLIIPSLIAAGLARVPFRRWLPVIASGEMIWTGSLVLIGYYATEAIKKIERGVEFIGLSTSIILALIVIIWLRRTLPKKNTFHASYLDDQIES